MKLGIDPPKGVLLFGPPGTGKTLCARAVANRTDACFIRVIGSELVQKYVGEVCVGGVSAVGWVGGVSAVEWVGGVSAVGWVGGVSAVGWVGGVSAVGWVGGVSAVGWVGGVSAVGWVGGVSAVRWVGGVSAVGWVGGVSAVGWVGGVSAVREAGEGVCHQWAGQGSGSHCAAMLVLSLEAFLTWLHPGAAIEGELESDWWNWFKFLESPHVFQKFDGIYVLWFPVQLESLSTVVPYMCVYSLQTTYFLHLHSSPPSPPLTSTHLHSPPLPSSHLHSPPLSLHCRVLE